MSERRFEYELQDVASAMDVSLRRLMAGVMSGEFSESGVTTDDMVRNEIGEPLFFRLQESRAYSIFGAGAEEKSKDMSTIERMSSTDERENTPGSGGLLSVPSSGGEVSTKGSRPPTAISASGASKTANPPRGFKTQGREPSQESGTLREVGNAALTVAGIYAGAAALIGIISNAGPSDAQLEGAYREGYRGYFNGMRYNPYNPDGEVGKAYQRGWDQARLTSN